jgi:hypothetical protein
MIAVYNFDSNDNLNLVGSLLSKIKQSYMATGFSIKAKRERPIAVFKQVQCEALVNAWHFEVILNNDHGTNIGKRTLFTTVIRDWEN